MNETYSPYHFGKQIRKLRKDRFLSQQEFAQLLSVSAGTVWKWENGTVFPELPTFCRICSLFDLSPNGFLSES